jgi:hypothetical protein
VVGGDNGGDDDGDDDEGVNNADGDGKDADVAVSAECSASSTAGRAVVVT